MPSSNYPRDRSDRHTELSRLKRLNEDISNLTHVAVLQLLGVLGSFVFSLGLSDFAPALGMSLVMVTAYTCLPLALLGYVAAKSMDKWFMTPTGRPVFVGCACLLPLVPLVASAIYLKKLWQVGQTFGIKPDLLNLNRKHLKAVMESQAETPQEFDWSKPPTAAKNPLDQ